MGKHNYIISKKGDLKQRSFEVCIFRPRKDISLVMATIWAKDLKDLMPSSLLRRVRRVTSDDISLTLDWEFESIDEDSKVLVYRESYTPPQQYEQEAYLKKLVRVRSWKELIGYVKEMRQ